MWLTIGIVVVALIVGIVIGAYLFLHLGIGTLLDIVLGRKKSKKSKKGGEKR